MVIDRKNHRGVKPATEDTANALIAIRRAGIKARLRALEVHGNVLIRNDDGEMIYTSDPKLLFPDGTGDDYDPKILFPHGTWDDPDPEE